MQAIILHKFGDPATSLRLEPRELPPLKKNDVRVRMKRAPINPADLNVIEGRYPIRPTLPGVPGMEGVGVVIETGSDVATVEIGQSVIPLHFVGTWCESFVCDEGDLFPVPSDIDVNVAAMVKVNPATAYCLLTDFVELEPGAWIVQNTANSAVGRGVIQIAKSMGIRTVNIVRNVNNIPELEEIGADVVVTGGRPLDVEVPKRIGHAPIRLALNAVGGKSAHHIAKLLDHGGMLVTYGAMSREPLTVGNGLLIFNDVRLRGFWVSAWYAKADFAGIQAMFQRLFELCRRDQLTAFVEKVYPIADFEAAITHASKCHRKGKILFDCQNV